MIDNLKQFFSLNNLKKLFKIGQVLDKKTLSILNIFGSILIILTWHLITKYGSIGSSLLPKPFDVLKSFPELYSNYSLFSNAWFSVKINLGGYLEAIIISLILGFTIGLIPLLRGFFIKWIDAFRFIPLTALNGIFIAWFGIEIMMKIHFLAFGIIIYLVAVIVQRIDEVEKVHLHTLITLGASSWQKFRFVYFPSVIARVSDDIRVLVAISWTYIVAIEVVNQVGGLGSLIHILSKQTRFDMVYALLITIILIGYIQDLLFRFIDYLFFPHKYESSQFKKKLGLTQIFIK